MTEIDRFFPNYVCRCKEELQLTPVLNYTGDALQGCHIRGTQCDDCPLHDISKLQEIAEHLYD